MTQAKTALVSIIIPFYNCQKYIKETLDCVAKQSYTNMEIILVNDGSSQEDNDYLQNLIQNRDICYIYQDNQGLSSARNAGAKLAKGDFLLFLDADDKIHPDYLTKTVEVMQRHPNCKIVYTLAEFFEAKTGLWQLPAYSTLDNLLKGNMIYCTALHKKLDFDKIGGFDENLKSHEDWDYWIRLLQDGGDVICLDEVLFYYRKRNDYSSLSDQWAYHNLATLKEDLQKIYTKHSQLYLVHGLGYYDLLQSIHQLDESKKLINQLDESKKQYLELVKKHNELQIQYQKMTLRKENFASKNACLHREKQNLEQRLDALKSLWIIRLFKPLIKLEQGLYSLNRYRQAFGVLMKEKGSFGKAYQYIRRYKKAHGFKSSKYHLKSIWANKDMLDLTSVDSDAQKKLTLDDGIVILTNVHTYYVAKLIKNALQKIHVESDIIFDEPIQGYLDCWHIVICPQTFAQLPSRYLAFQMEQSTSSRWLNQAYFDKLKNARFVFDYSLKNIEFFHNHDIEFHKLYYLPIGHLSRTMDKDLAIADKQYEYDVAFYGDINCPRRQLFLAKLEEKFKVYVIVERFGDDLYQALHKAKLIVNIHYYENALLETTRLYECLHLNKLVISEKAIDQNEHLPLEGLVDFVEIGDIAGMMARIDYWLADDEAYQKQLHQIQSRQQEVGQFDFYFYRFLLAQDLLGFDEFYRLSANYIKPQGNFWCLSLPESTLRRQDFQKDNHHNVWLMTGLRHHIGWVGCGLSYKFMMRRAKDLNLPMVIICEDDVLFLDDFKTRFDDIVQTLANTSKAWDVFSGLVADLSPKVDIQKTGIQSDGGQVFYGVDKLVSTVFNIYNQSIYDKIDGWDSSNRSINNTIDRYIENHGDIKGLIVSPYLVGHKEDLTSTLWHVQNSTYNDMIAQSQKLLDDKIAQLHHQASN